jgi:hypothetical protein
MTPTAVNCNNDYDDDDNNSSVMTTIHLKTDDSENNFWNIVNMTYTPDNGQSIMFLYLYENILHLQ